MSKFRFVHEFTAQGHVFLALGRLRKMREDGFPAPPQVMAVFMAFTVEAYINSVGARMLPFWDEVERSPWRSKLNILHSMAKQEADYGRAPLQFAVELFKFRDKFAHGKAEVWKSEVYEAGAASKEFRMSLAAYTPDWYNKINDSWIDGAVEQTKALLIYIGGLGGFDEGDHMHHSSGTVEEVD